MPSPLLLSAIKRLRIRRRFPPSVCFTQSHGLLHLSWRAGYLWLGRRDPAGLADMTHRAAPLACNPRAPVSCQDLSLRTASLYLACPGPAFLPGSRPIGSLRVGQCDQGCDVSSADTLALRLPSALAPPSPQVRWHAEDARWGQGSRALPRHLRPASSLLARHERGRVRLHRVPV